MQSAVLGRTFGSAYSVKGEGPEAESIQIVLVDIGLVTILRIATVLSLLMIGTGQAFSYRHLPDAESAATVSAPTLQVDRDPPSFDECWALGKLNIAFRTHNDGPPDIGVVVTDPLGRRIGFDPLTKHGWQELPVAQGSIDCDQSDGKDACRGLIEVCGALSGTYKLEVIANAGSDYTLTISALSEEVRDGQHLWSSWSEYDLSSIPIRKRSRNIISVSYSRDPNLRVAAQLQELRDDRYETRFHPNACQSGRQRQRGCLAMGTSGD